MRRKTRRPRSNSGSTSPSAGCGAKRSTVGRKRRRSIRPTPPPTTISRLVTSTKDSSTRRARRTRRRSSSTRTIRRSARTTSSSRKSMIGPLRRTNSAARRLVLACITAMLAAFVAACGTDYLEIPIETPIQPKLDVSAFQRVLVIGFVAGGTDDVDANQETVRLLRSQLRTKSSLKVIDADIVQLIEVARDQSQGGSDEAGPREGGAPPRATNGSDRSAPGVALPSNIKDEKDLEPYE